MCITLFIALSTLYVTKVSMLPLAQCDVPEGGLVPKSVYQVSEDHDPDRERSPDNAFTPDTLYHTAYVVKDYAQEGERWSAVRCFHSTPCIMLCE